MGRNKPKRKTKLGRNDPCPCGSGKKYKHCCGNPFINRTNNQLSSKFNSEIHLANELIRKQQQGLGRPIIASKFKGQQIVAVGNSIFHSPKWKTFPDFLSDYLKLVLGAEWGNSEIKKPLHKRHTILQWYDEYCRYQRNHMTSTGTITSSPMTGVVYCYLGLAYNLYLLKHNVELQNLLIKRLKNQANLQGAYYELIVASSLIRSGFDLVLEDETDKTAKHCEFAAISNKTGKRYWVEAKMRAVRSFFGKSEKDGTQNSDPTSELIKHINRALKKPAKNERLIFIDLNTDATVGRMPEWVERAAEKLDRREKSLDPKQKAYVFITNMPFHRALQSERSGTAVLAHGLNIPDFGKPGEYRLSEKYRLKQKHIDAHDILNSFRNYPQLPATFDGGLPSRLRGNPYDRIIIGETYFFEGVGEEGKGEVMTVTSATVNEDEKIAYIGTSHGMIFKKHMSDDEMDDYRSHPEAFFGKIQRSPRKKIEDPYEMFEFFLDSFKNTPKERLLEIMKNAPDFDTLEKMDQAELAIEYSERCCASLHNKFDRK